MSSKTYPELTAEEAASHIQNGMTVGFSGFTPAGATKVIPRALAARARAEHEAGREFKVGVLTGASTGASLDGELARADAVLWRTPYQSDPDLRKRINSGQTRFFDLHLSLVPQMVRYGFLGPVHCAVVEVCDVTPEGEITLTTSVGASNTYLQQAEKVILEWNKKHPAELKGMHDLYQPSDPPNRREIPIYKADDRIGSPTVKVDPEKIVGIVYTEEDDETKPFRESDDTTRKIGEHVAEFLAKELHDRRIPKEFLPIQSGVGNIANAVLGALGDHPDIPKFDMYSEVLQDSVIDLMLADKIRFASATSLTVTPEKLQVIYDDLEEFKKKIVLRPQEITNNPEVARRIGVISINTAIEVDIFGNVNSTHVLGKSMMNGIGGSGDFTRSAYMSIFTCPSVAKGGKISTIVPHCSHMDHSEHSVQVVITDQGICNMRTMDPIHRSRSMIDSCAHPDYREQLHAYCDLAEGAGYTPETLSQAFAMHQKFLESGDMRGVEYVMPVS